MIVSAWAWISALLVWTHCVGLKWVTNLTTYTSHIFLCQHLIQYLALARDTVINEI